MKKSKTVVPGDFLTVEEEFLPGKNTFEDKSGNIYSTAVGVPHFDDSRREVEIKAEKRIERLDAGSVVFGRVLFVRENMVSLQVGFAEKNDSKRIPLDSSATIMVSSVSQVYVKDLREMFKVGDIVKAKVVAVTPYSIELTTKFPEFGVIRAYCSKCRAPLVLFGMELKCLKCGSDEKRKISSDYSIK